MSGTPPDLVITAYDKVRNTGAQVGVGWTQDDGSISLVLNPGSALIYQANVSYKVKSKALADAQRQERAPREAPEPFRPQPAGWTPPARSVGAMLHRPKVPARSYDDMDDDIPF